jgi:hypothetical protein
MLSNDATHVPSEAKLGACPKMTINTLEFGLDTTSCSLRVALHLASFAAIIQAPSPASASA